MSPNKNAADLELRFWLPIMGDHARFIKNSLNPDQRNLIMVAANFIEMFDRLSEKLKQNSPAKEQFLTEITQATLSLRDLKRELLAERLKNTVVTSLSPILYNHMLNELEDFLSLLTDIEAGRQITEGILRQHLLWSSDAAVHAAVIGSGLDKPEYKLREIAKEFEASFDHFYIKAVELTGYFRSLPPSAGAALESYNASISAQMKRFMLFLEDLIKGIKEQKILGNLSPLMPDHMLREECYYLLKIAESDSNIERPGCDPGRPRII